MSHSTVLVVLPPSEESLDARIAAALAPFDENVRVDRYIQTDRAGHIAEFRESQERWRENRAEYLADPDGYGRSRSHIDYLLSGKPIPGKVPADKTFADEWTDGEIWAWLLKVNDHKLREYGEPKFDPDGNTWSTYNPRSKWDWWRLGGRWPNSLVLAEGAHGQNGEPSWVFELASAEDAAAALPRPGVADAALASDVDWPNTEPTFALLDAAGEWHERGRMGWFGIVHAPVDDWEPQWRALVESIPANHTVAVVDVHI